MLHGYNVFTPASTPPPQRSGSCWLFRNLTSPPPPPPKRPPKVLAHSLNPNGVPRIGASNNYPRQI